MGTINKLGSLITLFVLLIFSGCKTIGESWVANYYDPYHKIVSKAGFREKSFILGDVNLIYYEGPDNGPSLLIIMDMEKLRRRHRP